MYVLISPVDSNTFFAEFAIFTLFILLFFFSLLIYDLTFMQRFLKIIVIVKFLRFSMLILGNSDILENSVTLRYFAISYQRHSLDVSKTETP